MNILKFHQFYEEKFKLSHFLSLVHDVRPNPIIPALIIFKAVFFMAIFGLGSLLALDQFLRSVKAKRLFKSNKPVVSDTTMARSLEGSDLSSLHKILYSVYSIARRMGKSRCSIEDTNIRVGIIDGSMFKRFSASCFAEIGPVSLIGGIEKIEKRGKELPASKRLIQKLHNRFGNRFVDLILLDGLYFAQDFLRTLKEECSIDFLIKTSEVRLNIIQDAKGIFSSDLFLKDIEYSEGTDSSRMCTYKVFALDGFYQEGIPYPLKVAWVIEDNIRTGEHTEFWVITSMLTLTCSSMRELAHWRWDIENNGFKSLNELVHTKHIYSSDPNAAEAVLLLLFIAGNILHLFFALLDEKVIEEMYGKVKVTRKFLQRELLAEFATIPDT